MFSNNSLIPIFLSQEYTSSEVELDVEDMLVLPIRILVLDWVLGVILAVWWYCPCEDAVAYLPHPEDVESQVLETKTASVEQVLENRDAGELAK